MSYKILLEPQYFALFFTALTLLTTIILASVNRVHNLNRAIYFKKQQAAEEIFSRLLMMQTNLTNLKGIFQASIQNPLKIENIELFKQVVKTDNFERDLEKALALMYIYFGEGLNNKWNNSIDKMNEVFRQVLVLQSGESTEKIDWKSEADKFNKNASDISDNIYSIRNEIQDALKNYKNKKLK